jgi:hypothetical protein
MSWKVTRFCCTSGMCLDCRAVARGGKRKRILHIGGLTKEKAEKIAANWPSYGAKVEPEGAPEPEPEVAA